MKNAILETIRIVDGQPQLLGYHQARLDRACAEEGFAQFKPLCVLLVEEPCPYLRGVVKCRVEASETGCKLTYHLYQQKSITQMRVVRVDDDFDYHLKWADRRALQAYATQAEGADEVMLVRGDGHITDTSYTNLLFKQGDVWYTPAQPLLSGVQRSYLLDMGRVKKADITLQNMHLYSHVALINAMMPLEEAIVLPITAILP